MFKNSAREILVHNKHYALSRICDDDRTEYVELTRQISGEKTLFLNPVVKDIMWDGVLTSRRVFAILNESMSFCGAVELKEDARTPEIGIELLTKYRNKGIARNAVDLLIKMTYDPEKIDYYTVRIEKDNLHSRHVFEKMGAECLGDDLSILEKFKEYLSSKDEWIKDEEDRNTFVEIYKKFEDDAEVLKYRLDPARFALKSKEL